MAITLNGNGTVTGISAGGLPAGSMAMPAGSVIQTVYSPMADETRTSNGNNWVDYLAATITPTSSSNKILVIHLVTYGGDSNSYAAGRCYRSGSGTTDEYLNTGTNSSFTESRFTDASFPLYMNHNANDNYKMWQSQWIHLDTPSSTAAVTYTFAIKEDAGGHTAYINRSPGDSGNGYSARPTTTTTLMEIKV